MNNEMGLDNMKKNNKMKTQVIGCAFVILILLISILAVAQPMENISESNNELSATRSDNSQTKAGEVLENTLVTKSLTKFSSGGDRITLLGTPGGETIYIPIPPEANVTSASMNVQGKMPEEVKIIDFEGRLSHVAAADFNNDGNLDVITTDKDNETVFIVLSDGKYNFHSKTKYKTGDIPINSALEDFNNDGYIDFAIVNGGSNTITVYRNTGTANGNFDNRKDYKIGDWPRDITSADFNSDGWTDIASISSNDNKLWINLNAKSESLAFGDAINFSTDLSPVAIASDDVNNDGLVDIVVVNVNSNFTLAGFRYYYTASVFINKGDSKFQSWDTYPIGRKPADVVIRDFNNDGWQDIAASNKAGYNVSVLLNKGSGKFGHSINYSLIPSPYSGSKITSGDLDGDGDFDLVSLCSKLNTIGVLLNRGDGTFLPFVEYAIAHRPADIFLADFDNDGDLDISSSSQSYGTVSFLSNNGYGTFSTFEFYNIGTYPRGITSSDLDNDGDLDLISANYLGGSLSICHNDGNGNFEDRYDKLIAVEPFAVTAGDFDKDGFLDLVSADEALYKIVLAFNDGDGKFTKRKQDYRIGGYPYYILYEDLNGDGENEIISGNNAQLSISILVNYGNGTFAPFVDYSFAEHHPFGLAVGDVDGDNDTDIISTNYGVDWAQRGSNISIIWNEGNGTFKSHTDYDVGTMPISVKSSDLDLDGDLDLVVSNYGSNTTTILTNQENKSFGARRDYPVGPLPMYVYVQDINRDGYPDIITANQDNDTISVMYNKGDGTFTKHKEYLIGAQPICITVGDFNNDTRLDIATANLLSNTISVRMDIHYPGDVSVDIGADGTMELEHPDLFSKTLPVPTFAQYLNTYVQTHKDDITTIASGAAILVPVKITAQELGVLDITDLEITLKSPNDFDEDGIPDSTDEDDDNDNMPDDWEISFGLEPKDASDGDSDLDSDDLSNLEEFLKGTDPIDSDTDSDKLSDGVEVKEHLTDPMKKDTDSDGFSDYKEINSGTDPLDKNDYPDDSGEGVCFTPGFETGILTMALIILILILGVSYRRKKSEL
jgi:hypothetical protein